ncbi:MAG TPA: hypothetical protein VFF15_07340 [Flavobacteriaceae bacterium]|nr:hypothetical protein [Flavobacteriaceae bacterium]
MKIPKFLSKFKRPKTKKVQPQKDALPASYRITIHNNIALTPDSELLDILRCLNNYGISIKDKTVEEIEREIDKQLKSCIEDQIAKYPGSVKVGFVFGDFLNNMHNRNLIILKNHISTLRNWMNCHTI